MIDDAQMQHGHHWRGQRMKGWLLSEKFRGARAEWDGAQLWSRGGRAINLPPELLSELPGLPLSLEVFCGDGPAGGPNEAAAIKAVTHDIFPVCTVLKVFDAPAAPGDWTERLLAARGAIGESARVHVVDYIVAKDNKHPFRLMAHVHKRGGEGVVARHPDIVFAAGRTEQIVKLKRPFYAILASV